MTATHAPPPAGPPEYVVAVTIPPPIKCPDWCTVSYEEHAQDLPAWEGRVIHWSADHEVAAFDFRLARTAYVYRCAATTSHGRRYRGSVT